MQFNSSKAMSKLHPLWDICPSTRESAPSLVVTDCFQITIEFRVRWIGSVQRIRKFVFAFYARTIDGGRSGDNTVRSTRNYSLSDYLEHDTYFYHRLLDYIDIGALYPVYLFSCDRYANRIEEDLLLVKIRTFFCLTNVQDDGDRLQ